ncbi:hypothetical protein [Streptomyces malaysiensis]|uniref:Uncharacterized protein n=1 Tax=Streptomyces malaysiensis subsp. samsunensis TaxID=459658 RepID=A0A9X2LSH4_STRMQ|nr:MULTISPECIES: hypothetical protein [Streptomyces]MCQ8829565.1 hypothetical protein [Streptomyces samsunensis]
MAEVVSGHGPNDPTRRGAARMSDVVFIVLTVAVFAVIGAVARGAGRL